MKKSVYEKAIDNAVNWGTDYSKEYAKADVTSKLQPMIEALTISKEERNRVLSKIEEERCNFYHIGFKEGFETAIAKLLLK